MSERKPEGFVPFPCSPGFSAVWTQGSQVPEAPTNWRQEHSQKVGLGHRSSSMNMSFLCLPVLHELLQKGTLGLTFCYLPQKYEGHVLSVWEVSSLRKGEWVCTHHTAVCWAASWGNHSRDQRHHLPDPFFFLKLTVHIPLDASGGKFQGFIDLLQDSLQLLLLSNLWLGDLSNVQLLALEFLWGDEETRIAVIFGHRQP